MTPNTTSNNCNCLGKNHLTDFDVPIEIGGDDLAGLGSFIEFLLNLLVVFSLFSSDFGFF